jgi:hypothetical protein
MMEVVRTSETSVNLNVNTWRYIPEDSKVRYHVHKGWPLDSVLSRLYQIHTFTSIFSTRWPSQHFTTLQLNFVAVVVHVDGVRLALNCSHHRAYSSLPPVLEMEI